MKISYNWLKWYVPELPPADKLWDIFTFHLCEVESVEKLGDDTIFDINILPNRAHDLLSHQGVAYELSALCDIEFKSPLEMYKIPESKQTELLVKIESEKCRRYMGRIVRNVKVGPSPEWVVKHLESIGQKSINNVVDATNIVLFDCGQPTHVFDAKKVGNSIRIKEVGSEESITVLGGEEKKLKENDLVIADSEGNPLAIAGVKGGTKAEVDGDTTDIILEVANFEPVATRKTGRRMGLFTDALKRFENDLSPIHTEYAMRELSATILEMCPDAVFEDIVDEFPEREKWEEKRTIDVPLSYINGKLGTNFSSEEIESVWNRMKFEYVKDADVFSISVPSLRLDLLGEHDLVEEVGRVLGYDKVVPKLPNITFVPQVNEITYRMFAARQKLAADGYKEVMTYSFTKKGAVGVAYGAKGKDMLRTNLAEGLKEAYELNRLNAPFLELAEIKIFEIGNVFPKEGEEVVHVAWVDKKGPQEMTLEEYTKNISVGTSYGDVLPDSAYSSEDAPFVPWSAFPFIYRDVSLWVPTEVESSKVLQVIKENAGMLVVKGPTLIDSFNKDGRTSYAFRLVFQSKERTLTDEEVSESMEKVTKALVERGFEIR